MRGDGNRLRQVLSNLLSNAVKFTRAGRVELRVASSAGAGVRFEVRDTGIGMDEAALERLFEPFAQADASTTRRFGGTGLGLAISKQLCAAMGGRIEVSSEVGRGSTFAVVLPLPPAPAPKPAPPAEAPTPTALGPARVLVAEDNRINQMVIDRLLRRLGVEPVLVPDGAAAVAHVREHSVDIVLMDLHMPEMDGLEATRSIRALPGAAGRTPIVALTASALESDREACLEAGMDDHLAKPVESEALAGALRAWLRRADEPAA